MQLSSSMATRLEYQHKTLLELTGGLSDEQVRQQVISGKWSIFENTVHLATYQHTFKNRIKLMLEDEKPSFPRYSAESDPSFFVNCQKSTREIIHDLVNSRKAIVTKIFSLTKEQLERTGHHPIFGEMTILRWTDFFLLHEAHHLFTIFKLAANLGHSSDSRL